MFCNQCGKELEPDASFCPHCGAPALSPEDIRPHPPEASRNPRQSQPERRTKNRRKGRLLSWLAILLLAAVAAGGALWYFLFRPVPVDLNAYITVEFSGYDTMGTAQVLFQKTRFRQDLDGKIRCTGSKGRALREKAREREAFMEQSLKELTKVCSDVALQPWEALKNGDQVALQWNLDREQIQKDFNVTLTFSPQTFAVEGLPEMESRDVLRDVELIFEGTSPFIQARIDVSTLPEDLASELTLEITPFDHIANGDRVTLNVRNMEQLQQKYRQEAHTLLTGGSKVFSVAGMPETDPDDPVAWLEPITLKVRFPGLSREDPTHQRVLAALNPYLQDKLRVSLELAEEGADLCFWTGSPESQGLRLDALLEEYGPEVLSRAPEALLECARAQGAEGFGLYAVPTMAYPVTQPCWDVNASLLRELGYDPDVLCSRGFDYYSPEFAAMLQAAKAAGGEDFYPLAAEGEALERMLSFRAPVPGAGLEGLVSCPYDPENPGTDLGSTLVNRFDTAEFQKFVEKTYEYARLGYVLPAADAASGTQTLEELLREGRYLFSCRADSTGCVGAERDSALRGVEVRLVPVGKPYVTALNSRMGTASVSPDCQAPERAVMLLNLLYSDSWAMDTLCFGLEGEHYTRSAEGTVVRISDGEHPYHPPVLGMGNLTVTTPTEEDGPDFREEFQTAIRDGQALPMGGFFYAPSLQNEEALVQGVLTQYLALLTQGELDPAQVLPMFREQLNACGAGKILEDAQAQLTGWLTQSADTEP